MTVQGGTLNLSSNIHCNMIVQPNGVLSGPGTIFGNLQSLGGTIMPTEVLTVDGDLSLDSDSTVAITIASGATSSLNVSGQADLDGTLKLIVDGAIAKQEEWAILVGETPLNGQFASIQAPAGLQYELNYTPLLVQLTINRFIPQNVLDLSSIHGNNRVVGNYLLAIADSNIDLDEVMLQLSSLSAKQLNQILASLSPARNAFMAYTTQNDAVHFLGISGRHLSNQRLSGLLSSSREELLISSTGDQKSALLASSEELPPLEGGDRASHSTFSDVGIWGEAIGERSSHAAADQNPRFHTMTAGGLVGLDYYGWGNCILGGAIGGLRSQNRSAHGLGHQIIGSYNALVYGTVYRPTGYVELGLLGGYLGYNSQRHLLYPGYSGDARSRHDGWEIAPHLNLGVDFPLNKIFTLEPYEKIDWVGVWQGGFKERGASLLNMQQKHGFSSLLRGEIGINGYELFDSPWGSCLIQENIAYVLKQPFKTGVVQAALVGANSGFRLDSFTKIENLVAVGAEIFMQGRMGISISGNYRGEFGSGYSANQFSINIGKAF
jgi:outer membrane autotransporter protein